jgi:hypothetical protein
MIAAILAEFLFEITDAINAEDDLKPAAIVWFILLGLVAGIATCGIAPDRVLVPGTVPGVSLLIVPCLLGVTMAIMGSGRATRSHLATWYGGGALGFGLAVGRLVGLAFVAEVRSV